MTSLPRFGAGQVAALFLERQRLDRPRTRRLTATSLVDFASAVGGLQLDSINVLTRAHYLTVFSRFGPYNPATLDRLVYRRRLFFEYWAHAACLIPRADFPAWRRVMVEYGYGARAWGSLPAKLKPMVAEVEAAMREHGPIGSNHFEGRPKPMASGGWWNWKPATRALDYLWMSGRTMVHSREHFHKRFDLTERVLAEVAEIEPPSLDEFRRWHVRKSLAAMGAATEADLRMYLSFPRGKHLDRRATLKRMLLSGEVVEVLVDQACGRPARWFALEEDLPALARAGRRRRPSVGTTFLAPFDSFMWHRDRLRQLFAFDYTIEVYTPSHKRLHGYYTLPILHDGNLVGRVDGKLHREQGALELRHLHFEPWVAKNGQPPLMWPGSSWKPSLLFDGIAETAQELARFLGVNRVLLGKVSPSRFRPMLVAALRAAMPR